MSACLPACLTPTFAALLPRDNPGVGVSMGSTSWPSPAASTGARCHSASLPGRCSPGAAAEPILSGVCTCSSLVAKLVHMEFPQNSIACIGLSAALPKSQLAIARDVVSNIGIPLREVATKVTRAFPVPTMAAFGGSCLPRGVFSLRNVGVHGQSIRVPALACGAELVFTVPCGVCFRRRKGRSPST